MESIQSSRLPANTKTKESEKGDVQGTDEGNIG